MGIDTENKRRGALRNLPLADGAIEIADRWQIWVYPGLAALTPPPPDYQIAALRVVIYDRDGAELETVDFIQQEVAETAVAPFYALHEARLQSADPYIAVFGEEWRIITGQIRQWGKGTRDKLARLRSAAIFGYTFRVYPALIDEPELYYECLLPADVPVDFVFAGRLSGREVFPLVFYEFESEV